jgi:fucose permease
MSQKLNYKSTIFFIFFNMTIIGFIECMRGVFVEQFKSLFSVTDSYIGFMFAIATLGYIISTYIGGILCSKFGQRKVFLYSMLIMSISYILTALAPNFMLFTLAIFITNIGSGLQAISVNSISPILFVTYQTILITLTHFFFGFGVTLGQQFSGKMAENNIHFKYVYIGAFVLFLISYLISLKLKFPDVNCEKANLNPFYAFKDKLVILFILAQGFYVFSEVGFSNWFVNFATNSYNFNISTATSYLSLFFFMFTFGRLLGGFVVNKYGIKETMSFSLICATILFTSGYLLKSNFTVLISISGLFFSIVFPTTITMITKVFDKNTSYTMGVILTYVSVVNMSFNYIVGIFNDNIGVYNSFSLIPIALVLSTVFYISIFRIASKREIF